MEDASWTRNREFRPAHTRRSAKGEIAVVRKKREKEPGIEKAWHRVVLTTTTTLGVSSEARFATGHPQATHRPSGPSQPHDLVTLVHLTI